MIRAVEGPLVVQPEIWTLVFNREAATWWASWLAMGRYKHVRAYAYVPFLHVWVFFDPHIGGTDIVIAADGEPANRMIGSWIVNADLVRMRRQDPDESVLSFRWPGVWCEERPRYAFPLLGFCVPAIKRLIGLRYVALRPDALYRLCMRNGGEPFGAVDDGCAEIPAAGP